MKRMDDGRLEDKVMNGIQSRRILSERPMLFWMYGVKTVLINRRISEKNQSEWEISVNG